jgi:hypothetical protein
MSSFFHLSISFTLQIRHNTAISNTRSLASSADLLVHVSELYSKTDNTSERYTLTLVCTLMSLDSQILFNEETTPVAMQIDSPLYVKFASDVLRDYPSQVCELFHLVQYGSSYIDRELWWISRYTLDLCLAGADLQAESCTDGMETVDLLLQLRLSISQEGYVVIETQVADPVAEHHYS